MEFIDDRHKALVEAAINAITNMDMNVLEVKCSDGGDTILDQCDLDNLKDAAAELYAYERASGVGRIL
jgi:hypothetical protein